MGNSLEKEVAEEIKIRKIVQSELNRIDRIREKYPNYKKPGNEHFDYWNEMDHSYQVYNEENDTSRRKEKNDNVDAQDQKNNEN